MRVLILYCHVLRVLAGLTLLCAPCCFIPSVYLDLSSVSITIGDPVATPRGADGRTHQDAT